MSTDPVYRKVEFENCSKEIPANKGYVGKYLEHTPSGLKARVVAFEPHVNEEFPLVVDFEGVNGRNMERHRVNCWPYLLVEVIPDGLWVNVYRDPFGSIAVHGMELGYLRSIVPYADKMLAMRSAFKEDLNTKSRIGTYIATIELSEAQSWNKKDLIYEIVKADSALDLEKKVQSAMQRKWRLQGGVAVAYAGGFSSPIYVQAMLRPKGRFEL